MNKSSSNESIVTRMGKETLVYGLGNALNRFCSLLIFPLYAKKLGVADFARQDLVLTFAAVMAIIAGLGLDSGYARLFYEKNEKERSSLASTWGWFSLFSAFPLVLIAWLFSENLARILINDESASILLSWTILGVAFQILQRQSLLTLRLRRQPKSFVVVTLISALSQLTLALWFVSYLELGSLGVIYAYTGGSFVSLIASVVASRWIWRGHFSKIYLKNMLKFGLPLLPAAAATWGLDAMNRFMLQHMCGATETTLYGVGSRIAGMLAIVFFGFQMAWAPFAFSLMKNPLNAAKIYALASQWLLFVGGAALIVLSLFSPELIKFLTKEEYLSAQKIVPLLGFSALIWALFYIICVGYQYAKKTYHQLFAMSAGLLSVAISGTFLIPKFGALGAAYGTLFGYITASIYAAVVSDRYLKVKYPWRQILIWAVIICASLSIFPYILTVVDFEENYVEGVKFLFIKILILIKMVILSYFLLIGPRQGSLIAKSITMKFR